MWTWIKDKATRTWKWVKTNTIKVLLIITGTGIALAAGTTTFEPAPRLTIDQQISIASGVERNSLKLSEIQKIGTVARENVKFSGADYDIQITDIQAINGGVQVFARAWNPDGTQVGFGKDGSVDIERFVIINPPLLVDDPNGDVTRAVTDTDENGEVIVKGQRKLRYDPKSAILESIAHTISIKQQKFDSKNIVRGKVGNTTTTVYPDADTESTTVDGYTGSGTQDSWSLARNSAGSLSNDSSTTFVVQSQYINFNAKFVIYRGHIYFDTSSIGATDTIDSATLSLYADSTQDDDNDAQAYISIVSVKGNTIGSDTAVANGDFNDFNTTEMHATGERKDITSISTSAYTVWTLNTTGLATIARSGESIPTGGTAGITYFGVREGHDNANSAIASGGNTTNKMNPRSADYSGTSSDPKLVVEHSAPAAPTETPKQDIIWFD